MEDRGKKYVICGHYGATNLGDEAIGLGLIQVIKDANRKHEIVVLSYNKTESKNFYNRYLPEFHVRTAFLVPLGIRSLFRGLVKGELKKTKNEIKSCDRFILGGGGLFTDEKLYAVFLWGLQGFYALHYKKPLYLIGHSVGPLNTRIGKWVVKKIFSMAEFISVRDKESKILLEKLGIKKKIHVLCDMAMLMKIDEKMLNKKIVQKVDGKYFVLTFRRWDERLNKLSKKIVQVLKGVMQKYKLIPMIIPFQLIKENDQEIANKKIVQEGGLKKIVIQKYHPNILGILEQIKGAEFVIGVRLHSLIFASMMNVPFVGISYSKKVENFMMELGLNDYCLKNDQFEEDLLGIKISKMIEHSGDIRKILSRDISLMQKVARNVLEKVLK